MARILIADVEKNHGFLLKQELEDDGHSVDMIIRGDTSMPRFAGKPAYDVVLLDMQMPGQNYNQRLKRIRNHAIAAHLVVFAEPATSEERKDLLEAGADDCFAKHEVDRLRIHLRRFRDAHA